MFLRKRGRTSTHANLAFRITNSKDQKKFDGALLKAPNLSDANACVWNVRRNWRDATKPAEQCSQGLERVAQHNQHWPMQETTEAFSQDTLAWRKVINNFAAQTALKFQ